jgi:tol-pal system protein YbgF
MSRAGLGIMGGVALCTLLAAAGAVGAAGAPPAQPVAAGEPQHFIRIAGLFGESDEEKAARLEREQNQDDAINRLNDKVRDLQDTVRNLTGENETLVHRVQELDDKLDRQRKDFEYRLCAMAAQQLGAGTGQGDANAVPCPGGETGGGSMSNAPHANSSNGDSSDAGGSADNEDAGQHLAPGPRVLGTLPAGAANGPVPPPPAGSEDTHAEFSTAMNLLAKARYEEAGAAFRNFADTHPKDDLAPQAIYWVGDIAYVQKDYDNAARAFAEVIKKYPNSSRAPDSMLKLGQSLIAAGQKKEGCTALAALPAKYPHASAAVLSQGAGARKAVCRGLS